ncbi:MAG TPA: high-potential iron-sulfur protein [Candidatus Baltobacteraceae bacterium]
MDRKFTRSDALKSLIVLPALAAAIIETTDTADAKSSKAQFKYQSHPKGSAKCSGCSLFIPGKHASAMGQCKVVAGSISPNGWCVAYTAKH